MTMILRTVVTFPVTPVEGRDGWFAIAGAAEYSTESGISDFYCGQTTITGAKVVGFHDNEDFTEDDPRFNGEFADGGDEDDGDEAAFTVNGTAADGYTAAMLCNGPEGLLFMYARDQEIPEAADDYPAYKLGAVEAEAANWKKQEAESEARKARGEAEDAAEEAA
ncbi:hypothetical protein LNV09_14450 [Paucibacter sp. B2R-40]|uniref:hypothetical protein n=1 Tax=Paucibacter sp. B2R-40 TaxID=2893554 RepID=UPI0021E3625C|nr:hypothetical protein [Paucibacter sp. B2R-40]MCV2355351.1 hypothetical protein [Paucibacter sp. B2R-40]